MIAFFFTLRAKMACVCTLKRFYWCSIFIFCVHKLFGDGLSDTLIRQQQANLRAVNKLQVSERFDGSFDVRLPRSAPENVDKDNFENQKLLHSEFILGNDTSHNNALIHWSGENSTKIFILTKEVSPLKGVMDSSLWRSTNYGTSYELQDHKLKKNAIISALYTCPININKIILVDFVNTNLYISTDEGESYKKSESRWSNPQNLTTKFHITNLVFHPTNQDRALAYDAEAMQLFETDDLGLTWSLVESYVSNFFWTPETSDSKNKFSILIETKDIITGKAKLIRSEDPQGNNRQRNYNKILDQIDLHSLLVLNQYTFVQKTTEDRKYLYVSQSGRPFQEAMLPFDLTPGSFYVAHVGGDQIFLAVSQLDGGVTDLYHSDSTGIYYTPTLFNIVTNHQNDFVVDFYQVEGLGGTYLCNQYKDPTKVGGAIHSLITFNKGRDWSTLPAPRTFFNGTQTNCHPPSCSLHLHMGYSNAHYNLPIPLSKQSSIGMIIAHGNIGSSLSNFQGVGAFISRDGGLIWTQMFQTDPFIWFSFVFMDHGGAMLAANITSAKQSSILYSYDEGSHWEEYTFTKNPIVIDGIFNEPGEKTLIANVFGHTEYNGQWSVIKLDFALLLSRPCQKEDFTSWIPSNLDDDTCLLGQELAYEKRRPESVCVSGQGYSRPIKTSICECLDTDYECDFGYQTENGTCFVEVWFLSFEGKPLADCPEGEFYNSSSGYRKMVSSKCVGGVEDDYEPDLLPCPLVAPSDLSLTSTNRAIYATGEKVFVTLTQGKGSRNSTLYQWNFGDGHSQTLVGYETSRYMEHVYDQAGFYHVTVNCTNSVGTLTASYSLDVYDKLSSIAVETPHAVSMGKVSDFNLTLEAFVGQAGQTAPSMDIGLVHFVWDFGNTLSLPILSWNGSMQYAFYEPGYYQVNVEAINAVSRIHASFPVKVYAWLKTVRLLFTQNLDMANLQTLVWRVSFANLIANKLTQVLDIERDRLEVVVLPSLPTIVEVSILPIESTLPPIQTHSPLPSPSSMAPSLAELDKITSAIIQAVESGGLEVSLSTGETITAIKATDVDAPPEKPEEVKFVSQIGYYIGIPVGCLLAIALISLLFHCSKQYCQTLATSYAQMGGIRNSYGSGMDGSDSNSQQISFDSTNDDTDTDAFQQFGSMPTLVLMSDVAEDDDNDNTQC